MVTQGNKTTVQTGSRDSNSVMLTSVSFDNSKQEEAKAQSRDPTRHPIA